MKLNFTTAFWLLFRALSKLIPNETATEILTGCLRPCPDQRIGLDSLVAAGHRLLAVVRPAQKQIDDAKALNIRKHHCGDCSDVGTEKKEATKSAGALSPSMAEPGLARSAGLFNRHRYVEGKRRAEWLHIQREGEERAKAWQDLKACRCHGQCGAREHRNRRQRPCLFEGTIKCRDVKKHFNY